MRGAAHRRCSGTILRQVLPGSHAFYFVRRGSRLPLSLGSHPARTEDVWLLGDDGVHRDRAGRPLLCVEKRRTRLGTDGRQARGCLMPLAPPITDIEQLKAHPALGRLVGWNASVVQAGKFDREELTIWVEKDAIREVCAILPDSPNWPFNYLCDLTCGDWDSSEPRVEGVYKLLLIR